MSSGVVPELVKVSEPGNRQVFRLTLRTLGNCYFNFRTKWWCGYKNQENVIIDEFRGVVDISHLLRWLDRYPVRVESKGGSRPLLCKTIWLTSNLAPEAWYPDLDVETRDALLRRLTNIIHFEYFLLNSTISTSNGILQNNLLVKSINN